MKATVKYYKNEGRFTAPVLAETETHELPQTTGYEDLNDMAICDRMYNKYNMDNRPDGKIRTSMSVGDLVSIDGRVYACSSFGWVRL